MSENEAALRERLAKLSKASLRINESLDFDTVLQGVMDGSRQDGKPHRHGGALHPMNRPSPYWCLRHIKRGEGKGQDYSASANLI